MRSIIRMAKPYRLKEVEQQHGNLYKIIPELVNKLGSQKAAADELGVSQATISIWLRENNYRPHITYVKTSKGDRS
jgi:DNA invertase Pin-like site-specific DNA recombinase